MMRSEVKVMRNAGRTSCKSYLCYGLIAGFMLLLTYFMVSTQLSIYNPNGFAGASPMRSDSSSPIMPDRSAPQQDGKEDADKLREKPSTTTLDDQNDNDKRQEEDWEENDEQGDAKNDLAPFKLEESQKEAIEQSDEDWKAKDQIEEFGNDGSEMTQKEQTDRFDMDNKWQNKDTVEFSEFGGGTDDFNHATEAKPICNTSFAKFDICDLSGDARTIGGNSTVLLVSPRSRPQQWKIKPYSRKYLDGLKAVAVNSLNSPQEAPPCTSRLNVPAMVFELGGLTGNYWHDFTDVLIPLFIGARQFNGEVQFLIVNMLSFWVDKYKNIFHQFSHYEIIDFDKDYMVRCYPRVLVGYGSHKEFTIDRSEALNGYTMVDFTKFMRNAYSLGRDFPIKLRENPGKKPRLMILERTNSRRFLNLHEVVRAAQNVGFEVMVIGKIDVSYSDYARIVNSFDVMLGVHGAGLTNCVFLPTNAVLIQIVPYGKLEHIAQTDFGEPASDMQLRYIEYSISAEESSLLGIFGKDHPLIKDPIAIHQSDWGRVAEWYLGKQDVRINIERFTPVLVQALQYLQ